MADLVTLENTIEEQFTAASLAMSDLEDPDEDTQAQNIANHQTNLETLAQSPVILIREAVAKNTLVSSELLEEFIQSAETRILNAAAGNSNLNDVQKKAIINLPLTTETTLAALASITDLPESVQLFLSSSLIPASVRVVLAANTGISESTLIRLAEHQTAEIRTAILANASSTTDVIYVANNTTPLT